MKVRIAYTVDVDERFRRALNSYFGREGLATREQIKNWCIQNGSSVDDDMLSEYDDEREERA